MRYLTVDEVVELHELVIARSGGGSGVREIGGVESAVAQPQVTFGGADLYPSIAEKGAAIAFSLVMNHPFVDGNKRIGHAAMETFLILNGYHVEAGVDDQEQMFLNVAAGLVKQSELVEWLKRRIEPLTE